MSDYHEKEFDLNGNLNRLAARICRDIKSKRYKRIPWTFRGCNRRHYDTRNSSHQSLRGIGKVLG